MLDIRHLRHLIAIAEEGTLQKASERLHITQPALTKSMQTLEYDLDAKLFDRIGRRLRLTDIGQELVISGKRILRTVRDTEDMVNNWRSGASGRITIGLGPAYSVLLSANLVEKILSDHGPVHLQIESGDTDALLAKLLNDDLHLAVCDLAFAPSDPDISVIDLQPQSIVGLVRKNHSLAGRNSVTTKELSMFPIAHSPAPAQFTDFSVGLAGLNQNNQGTVCLANNYDAFAQTSEKTDLITLLPQNLAEIYTRSRHLEIITLADVPQKSSPKILTRSRGKPLPPIGQKIIDHIQTLYG